ncbi:MAG TPA: 6-phosphogluconolactonase [Polyangiales bacterium]|nr:6-phosphogluconolactonase [Polyangiales bacterium]
MATVHSTHDSPHVSVSRDVDALMTAAALRVATLCREAIKRHGRFNWVLAGGNTPRQLYSLLAQPPFVSNLDWPQVEFFWGDERCVPPDHPDSNFRMARETLLNVVQPDPARVHRMRGEDPPNAAAADYEAELQHSFGLHAGTAPPSFDLILLGMGADGHTASLFPHSPTLRETQRWVTFDPAAARLTLTRPVLNAGTHVLFLVSGANKAARLKHVLAGPDEGLPAQRIRPAHGQLEWLVDAAAAAGLEAP